MYIHHPSSCKTKSHHRMWNSGSTGNLSSQSLFLIHLICGVGLAGGFWVAHNVYSFSLLSHPSHTLRLIWVVETPIVTLLFSCFRLNPDKCSYLKAVLRGLLGLPAGALVNALGAIALGAPVGIQYIPKTINWSLLMSLFTFVPAASVFGSAWADWQRIYAYTKPNCSLEYMICIPAHGAVIGAWFGAWPMPLDWERPWQTKRTGSVSLLFWRRLRKERGVRKREKKGRESAVKEEWPICVSYGAIIGYLVGMVASLGLSVVHGRQKHHKGD